MSLRYFSGVEVQAGDHIFYGEAGNVEFVACPEGYTAWYAESAARAVCWPSRVSALFTSNLMQTSCPSKRANEGDVASSR